MKTNQAGMFTPILVGIVLTVAAAMMPLPPDSEITRYERLRFEHATWWFWQRAVIHYHRTFDIWPTSLDEVATTFSLSPAPEFLLGTVVADRFKLSWLNLSVTDLEILSSKLQHSNIVIQDNRIEALMGTGTTFGEIEGVHRYESSALGSAIAFDDHDLVNVRDIFVNEASVTLPGASNKIRATSVKVDSLTLSTQVFVEKIAPDPLRVDELSKLLNDINRQYDKLVAHMQSAPDSPSPYQSSSEY